MLIHDSLLQLQGTIDDCSCNVDTVDFYNNVKIFPRLRSLLVKDFFRYYKVNLMKECPFWVDDSKCAMRFCHVEQCEEKDIPPGLKGDVSSYHKVSARCSTGMCDMVVNNLVIESAMISQCLQLHAISKWLFLS